MMSRDGVERIGTADRPLCYIVSFAQLPQRTVFPFPDDVPLQAGYIAYPEAHEIPRHVHVPVERRSTGTTEVLLVLRGRCLLDVYDDERQLVATRELSEGAVMLMVGGGHGFRMLEPTVLFEVKQGPYIGAGEKERF